MKIDFSASGVPLDPQVTQDLGKRNINFSSEGKASVPGMPVEWTRESDGAGSDNGGDRVELGTTSSNRWLALATYDMSDLKKKADTRLRELRPPSDGIRPLQETHLGSSRESLVEMARKRMEDGFYNRTEVIDEISRRLAEEF